MKVTIEAISRKEKVSKAGKPYNSVGIMVNGEWLSGFGDEINATWRKGDLVNVKVTPNGEFKNFVAVSPVESFEERIRALEAAVFNSTVDPDIGF